MQNDMQTHNLATLPDGRRLAYAEYGNPQGRPLIYCHGFPGSRLEAKLFEATACRNGVRIIAPDRNGLGMSDPLPKRTLLDWPDEIAALADYLGLERFHLIGVSGGGPYALACARRLTDRLAGVALVCPLGPLEHSDLLWAMRWPALLNFNAIKRFPRLSPPLYRHLVVPLVKRHPQLIYRLMLAVAPAADHQVLSLPQVQSEILASLEESLRNGADGVLQEMAIYTSPWGFAPEEITLPIQLWHGTADETVPPHPQLVPRTAARRLHGTPYRRRGPFLPPHRAYGADSAGAHGTLRGYWNR